jgi:hypothetical protein
MYVRSCGSSKYEHGMPQPRATSHMRLRARTHYTASTLIGGKVGLIQVRFTLRLRDQWSTWMQDGCKVYIGSYMTSNGSWFMFHGHLDYFQKPLLGGRPNTKPGDHGISNAHNRWFNLFYFIMCEDVSHKPPPLCVVIRVRACGSHSHLTHPPPLTWSRSSNGTINTLVYSIATIASIKECYLNSYSSFHKPSL